MGIEAVRFLVLWMAGWINDLLSSYGRLWRGPGTYDPLVVYQPKTWLLREGWKKAGAISYREVPSAKR